MQAQDFAGARWAVGCRIPTMREADFDHYFNQGEILRTHVLRPTWHLVLPEDIGWMLRLTGPRIKAFSKGIYRRLGITEASLKRSRSIMEKALVGKKHLNRAELAAFLQKGRINTDDIRMTFYLMDAELEGLICSGPRLARQFTYTLLEDRIGDRKVITPEDPVAELALRYFRSRGPATLHDFAWWGGQTLGVAKKGLEAIKGDLSHRTINGQAYWFSEDLAFPEKRTAPLQLLPPYDEYTVAYKDRSDVLSNEHKSATSHGIGKPTLTIGGTIAGTWKRAERGDTVHLDIQSLTEINAASKKQLESAAKRYGSFLEKPVVISIQKG